MIFNLKPTCSIPCCSWKKDHAAELNSYVWWKRELVLKHFISVTMALHMFFFVSFYVSNKLKNPHKFNYAYNLLTHCGLLIDRCSLIYAEVLIFCSHETFLKVFVHFICLWRFGNNITKVTKWEDIKIRFFFKVWQVTLDSSSAC